MASIEYLILFLVGTALISYILTKVNTFLGSVFTIFSVMFVFVSVAAYGLNLNLVTTTNVINWFSFSQTYLGLYFALIIIFIYLMVSFFHPYFLNKYKYKDSYNMLFLLSLAGILGAFFTDNFIQLFFFFELIIWSTMFLIPQGKSREAAVTYYGFSVFGSVSMLLGIFIIYANTTSGTPFALSAIQSLTGGPAVAVFVLFLIAAFAKLGVFPLHIWLPVAHGNAPHPFSPVLSGALVKLGAFISILALIRLAPVSANVAIGPYGLPGIPIGHYLIAILGSLSIVFGTLMAIRSDDAKKLLAYSSMSHGGYIIVAFSLASSMAFAGGFYHILAHAVASAAAFMAIGAVARATGTTKMSELGGMIHKMPLTYLAYLIAIISMAGIPPMGGFISKWMIYQAVINKGLIFIAIATFFGSIGSFLYVFRPLAALFLGQELTEFKKVKEEPLLMLIPTFILMGVNIYTGIFPAGIINYINKILTQDLGMAAVSVSTFSIQGSNGVLNAPVIALVFGAGVFVAFIIFMVLKKSRQVTLMDTYTAANFVHDEHLLHYSTDFYAPLERMYAKYINIMKNFYAGVAQKVKELGKLGKYLFMSKNISTTIFWIIAVIILLLWGEKLW